MCLCYWKMVYGTIFGLDWYNRKDFDLWISSRDVFNKGRFFYYSGLYSFENRPYVKRENYFILKVPFSVKSNLLKNSLFKGTVFKDISNFEMILKNEVDVDILNKFSVLVNVNFGNFYVSVNSKNGLENLFVFAILNRCSNNCDVLSFIQYGKLKNVESGLAFYKEVPNENMKNF